MTYKNRMTKPKTNKGTGWYFHGSPIWDKRSNNKAEDRWSTVPKHKLPYLKKGFSDNIDPESGKYFGWSDSGFKDKGLKKRHRAYAQVLIAEALMTMEEDKPCPFCGSSFCEDTRSCEDGYYLEIEWEFDLMEYDLEAERLIQEEKEREWLEEQNQYEDDYYGCDWDY